MLTDKSIEYWGAGVRYIWLWKICTKRVASIYKSTPMRKKPQQWCVIREAGISLDTIICFSKSSRKISRKFSLKPPWTLFRNPKFCRTYTIQIFDDDFTSRDDISAAKDGVKREQLELWSVFGYQEHIKETTLADLSELHYITQLPPPANAQLKCNLPRTKNS